MTSLDVAKLAERLWEQLSAEEQAECERWVREASGRDLHVLLRYIHRRGRRQSTTFKAPE